MRVWGTCEPSVSDCLLRNRRHIAVNGLHRSRAFLLLPIPPTCQSTDTTSHWLYNYLFPRFTGFSAADIEADAFKAFSFCIS